MAVPVASSSQPVQIPALQGPHAGEVKKPKEKKDKAAAAASQYALEVSNLARSFIAHLLTKRSFNRPQPFSIIVSRCSRSCMQNIPSL